MYFFVLVFFIHSLTTGVQGDLYPHQGWVLHVMHYFARFYASGCKDTIRFQFLQPWLVLNRTEPHIPDGVYIGLD